MENETKIVLFVGGSVDGQIMEIQEIEPRLNWYGVPYLSRGRFETKKYGNVHLYILEGMEFQEEEQMLDVIKNVL